jgi:putative transposase
MSEARYLWRQLTLKQREEILEWRTERRNPWHSPPHRPKFGISNFHISAACYEHRHHIGHSKARMDDFGAALLEVFKKTGAVTHSWCLLPNQYHALVQTIDILGLFAELGKLHGRASYNWNKEEISPGRKIFHRASDRAIRSERHFWATMNYIHNNPVHHGYVNRWEEWPWSSASSYLEQIGRPEAPRIWREYPLKFGAKWDPPDS